MVSDENNIEEPRPARTSRDWKELPAKPRTSAGLLVGVTLLGLAAGGLSVWMVTQRGHPVDTRPATSASTSSPQYLIRLEGFTVNLADPGEAHFLRITIELATDHAPNAADKAKDSAGFPKAQIRDSVLSVLTVCKADTLLTAEGKQSLKKNLLEILQHDIPTLGVRDVYFTEFLVQR